MARLTPSSTLADFRTHVNTPVRRHAFHCYAAKRVVSDSTFFLVLVEAYRTAALRRKAQVRLLHEIFLEGKYPKAYAPYVAELNLSSEQSRAAKDAVAGALAIRTFIGKLQTFGLSGALKAVGNSVPAANVFDDVQAQAWDGIKIDVLSTPFDTDATYSKDAKFSAMLVGFKQDVTKAGWNAEDCGIHP